MLNQGLGNSSGGSIPSSSDMIIKLGNKIKGKLGTSYENKVGVLVAYAGDIGKWYVTFDLTQTKRSSLPFEENLEIIGAVPFSYQELKLKFDPA